MNRLGLFAAATAIVALPAGVLGKPEQKPIKVNDKGTNQKSVPAPAPLILIGVAAGVAGLVRRGRRRRTRE